MLYEHENVTILAFNGHYLSFPRFEKVVYFIIGNYSFGGLHSFEISPARQEFICSRVSLWLNPCPKRNINLVTAHSGVLS